MQTSKVSFGNLAVYNLEKTGQKFLRKEYKNAHIGQALNEAKADIFGTATHLENFGIKHKSGRFIAATGADETALRTAIDIRKTDMTKAQEIVNKLIKKWDNYK